MKWQKRECPIKMTLIPYGAGWEDVIIDIQGDHHHYAVSGCLGGGFGALVESLYALYPGQSHCEHEERRISDMAEFVCDYKDGKKINVRPRTSSDSSYFTVPTKAEFIWDEEGHGVSWTISRPANEDHEFLVTIELEEWKCSTDGYITTDRFRYVVQYSDLCYAVGKAMTEAVKSHGFTGFHVSVWESDINVRQLCFLKACGMRKPEFFAPKRGADDEDASITSFKDEIELLMFDM